MKEVREIICDSEEKLNCELVELVKMLTDKGKPCCIRVLDHNKDIFIGGAVNRCVDENFKRPDGQYLYQGTFVNREVPVKAYLKYSRAVEIYEIKTVSEPLKWVENGKIANKPHLYRP